MKYVDKYNECIIEIQNQIIFNGPVNRDLSFDRTAVNTGNYNYEIEMSKLDSMRAVRKGKMEEFLKKFEILRELQIYYIAILNNEIKQVLGTAQYNEEVRQRLDGEYERVLKEIYKKFNSLYQQPSEIASNQGLPNYNIDHAYDQLKIRLDHVISQPFTLDTDNTDNGSSPSASSYDVSSEEKKKPPCEEEVENKNSPDYINSIVGASAQSSLEGVPNEQLQSVVIHANAYPLAIEHEPIAQPEPVSELENIPQQNVEDATPQKDETTEFLLKAQIEELIRRNAEKDAQIAQLLEIINQRAEGKVNFSEPNDIIGEEFPLSQDDHENQGTPLAGSGLD